MNIEEKILLASGTNEMEIVEFHIHKEGPKPETGYYGINVAKVREVIKMPPLTRTPHAHPAVAGMANIRGTVIPIVNLVQWLGHPFRESARAKVIITEFNQTLNGFLVHDVSRIHRIPWSDVEPPGRLVAREDQGYVTGIIKRGDRILFLLDFEKIVAEINPETAMRSLPLERSQARAHRRILVVEDSPFMRRLIVETLEKGGYGVDAVENGREALLRLQGRDGERPRYDLVVSDIEMPQVDGLHLVKRIKESPELKRLPVVLFSSLAGEDNVRKWQSLGAEGFISKPRIKELVALVDRLLETR